MTPKEKAKELFDKMYLVDDPMGNYPMCFDTAKQCALIAVDEILNDDWYIPSFDEMTERKKYWQEVKNEINNL